MENFKLDPNVKKTWTNALRSGKYLQGSGRLHRPENNTYCCLGVAESCGLGKRVNTQPLQFLTLEVLDDNFLPISIQRTLAMMNDGNKTFNQIADYIDQNL